MNGLHVTGLLVTLTCETAILELNIDSGRFLCVVDTGCALNMIGFGAVSWDGMAIWFRTRSNVMMNVRFHTTCRGAKMWMKSLINISHELGCVLLILLSVVGELGLCFDVPLTFFVFVDKNLSRYSCVRIGYIRDT